MKCVNKRKEQKVLAPTNKRKNPHFLNSLDVRYFVAFGLWKIDSLIVFEREIIPLKPPLQPPKSEIQR